MEYTRKQYTLNIKSNSELLRNVAPYSLRSINFTTEAVL